MNAKEAIEEVEMIAAALAVEKESWQERIQQLESERDRLILACRAGLRYGLAIVAASEKQPESMNLWRTVEGDDLDDLFEAWVGACEAALEKAGVAR